MEVRDFIQKIWFVLENNCISLYGNPGKIIHHCPGLYWRSLKCISWCQKPIYHSWTLSKSPLSEKCTSTQIKNPGGMGGCGFPNPPPSFSRVSVPKAPPFELLFDWNACGKLPLWQHFPRKTRMVILEFRSKHPTFTR